MTHRLTKWLIVPLLVLVALVGTRATPLAATQTPSDTLGTYTVVQGTTLWKLAARMYGNGEKWKDIYAANLAAGVLTPRDTFTRKGVPIAILQPGQQILLGRAAAKATDIVQSAEPKPVTAAQEAAQTLRNSNLFWAELLFLLTVAVIPALAWYARRQREQRLANPVTSGPPMREGGLSDEIAETHFQQRASELAAASGNAVPPERIRVVNIRRGRGYGIMQVRYRGRPNPEEKRLTGEVCYRATVEFPDGHQETMYALQPCGNDLVYRGDRYDTSSDFRFEEEAASIPVSQQPVTTARMGSTDISIGNEEIVVTHQGRAVTFGVESWGLREGEDGGIVISSRGRNDVLFRDGRVYGTPVPAATPAPALVDAAE